MSRTQIESVVRLWVVTAILVLQLSPALVLARPAAQQGDPTATVAPTPTEAVSPTPTDTVEVTPTETVEVTPTETPAVTAAPTETATVEPAQTITPTGTATSLPTETATLEPSQTLTPTETVSLPPTETATLEASPTLTFTAGPPVPTLTPTPVTTPTATLTPTISLTPTVTPTIVLSLVLATTPTSISVGEPVTVTLTLSNPTASAVDNLSLRMSLPAELAYEQAFGPVTPSYDSQSRQLTWQILSLGSQTSLNLGYLARSSQSAASGNLTLVAELFTPGSGVPILAQTTLTLLSTLPPTATPTPRPQLIVAPPGPPAQVQLGVEPQAEAKAAEIRHWLAVAVTDADGRAVADGTAVILTIQGGKLAQDRLPTKAGIATTEFKAPPGQTVLITASAGQIQATLQWPEPVGPGLSLPPLLKERDPGYGTAAGAIHQARHRLRQVGDSLRADNPSRWANFGRNGLNFQLKRQAAPGETQAPAPLSLDLSLTEVRVGSQSLLPDPSTGSGDARPQPVASGAWVLYQSEGQPWQMVYEVGEASVEQYFVFEKGTPIEGDLAIELRLETALKPVLISDEEGLRFEQPSGKKTEGQELAYGPVLVEDAGGRQIRAQLELQGKRLRLTIPEAWLAQALFPIVVDPVIGPATLVSSLQGGISEPVVASDGTDFLSIWGWKGDLYGQRVQASGQLTGALITISQAEGLQAQPTVTYNPASDEYLVVWRDERYGPTYPSLRGQRLSADGQLVGDELELLPPSYRTNKPGVAAATGGAYLVTWSEWTNDSFDLYGQLLQANGVLSGTVLTISNASLHQDGGVVAYDSQADMFLVAWPDNRDNTYDIYGQLVRPTGVLSGSNQQLAGNGDSQPLRGPAVAADNAGQFLVVWDREVNSGNLDIQARRVSGATGQPQGSVLNIYDRTETDRLPAVARLGTAAYWLVWYTFDDLIAGRKLNSDNTLSSAVAVNNSGFGRRLNPAIAAGGSQMLAVWPDGSQSGDGQRLVTGRRLSSSGPVGDTLYISPYYSRLEWSALTYQAATESFLLAWQQALTSPSPDILVQRLDAQGQPLDQGFNLTLHSAAQERPAIEAGLNSSLVVWQDSRNSGSSGLDIYGHLLDSSGSPSGTLLSLSTASGDQRNPAIAYNSGRDEYLVLWDDFRNGNYDIYGQIVRPDGSLGGSVGLTVSGPQAFPDLAYNPAADTYLLVWEDARSGTYDIYGRVISGSGATLGSDFAVVSVTDQQFDPVVAYGATVDRYLVSWWDRRSGNYDIYGQLISGTGVLSGSSLAISTPNGSSEQAYPAIASEGDQFLVVWEDQRNAFWRDIYGQRVSGSGQLLDETETGADETNPGVNIPFDTSGPHTERVVVVYRPGVSTAPEGLYLLAWNNRNEGGIHTRRYSSSPLNLPGASFTASPVSGQPPLTVTFTDTSTGTIVTKAWNFGDGSPLYISPLTQTVVTHTYLTTGTFTVVLTLTNPSGSVTATTRITVTTQPAPVADFAATPLTGTVPLTVTFSNSSSNASSYLWDFGDGLTSTLVTPTHVYTQAGVYTVSLRAEGLGGSDTLTRSSYITVTGGTPLQAGFGAFPTSGTVPLLVLFLNNATGNPTSYLWDFGDGITSTLFGPTHTYTIPGVYTVSLTVSDGSQDHTLTKPTYITVTPDSPITDLSAANDSPTYLGLPTTLTATISDGSNVSYTWAFGDGDTGTGEVVTHTYPAVGVYTALVTATNSVSLVTTTTTVTITAGLALSKAGPAAVTSGDFITYTLTLTNLTGFTVTNLLITDTLPLSASYISGGTQNGEVISWTVPGLAGGEVVSLTLVVTANQTITNSDYAVVAESGLLGLGQPEVTTQVYPPFQPAFTAEPVSGLVPLTVTFTASATGASSYLWNFGDGGTLLITEVLTSPITATYVYTQAGIYTVTLAVSNGSLTETLTRPNYITATLPRDWHLVTTTTTPPITGEHGLAYDSERQVVVLYGGNGSGWPYERTTWEFDGTGWLTTTTTGPAARYGMQMVYLPGEGVLLFGGSNQPDRALAQTWIYTDSAWSELAITGPLSRTYHAMTSNPLSGTLYLFGGNNRKAYYNDLWQYENGAWSEITAIGDRPVSRTLTALTYDAANQRLLLFGGRSLTGTLLADLWAFDLSSSTWTQLDDGSDENDPPARLAHSLTYDPGTGDVVLVGGVRPGGSPLLGDTWHYQDGWSQADPVTPLPPRAYHQAVPTDNAILLFSKGELWRYE